MSDDEGGVIIVCGPSTVWHHVRSEGESWCFTCRARREFEFGIWREAVPSYWGPSPSIRCTSCQTNDADLFPGRVREWNEL